MAAQADLDRLIIDQSLPDDSRARVVRSLRPLARFPEAGSALAGDWEGLRFVLGPWRWMLLVDAVLDDGERVVVVTIQDARSSTAATSKR